MNQIACKGMTHAPAGAVVGQTRPYPMAGGVGTRSGSTTAAVAEPGHEQRGDQAGAAARTQCTDEQRPPGQPLHIFIVGGSGLIGSALAEHLVRSGHQVYLGVRDASAVRRGSADAHRISFQFPNPPGSAVGELLRGMDVVVNAAGIFREDSTHSFDDVHVKGPCSLFELAAHAGVPRIIQISALGADLHAATGYWRSKACGDRCAWAFPGTAVVVRPSLVYAEEGASSLLFHRLAVLPWLPLPATTGDVQPIHLTDLVEGLCHLVDCPDPPRLVAAVGPVRLSIDGYLQALSSSNQRQCTARIPLPLMLWLARWLPSGSVANADALRMLAQPNTADPAPWRAVVGRPLRVPGQFVAPERRQQAQRNAVLANLLPVLRLSISLTWLVTAWVSAFAYPHAASLDLLVRAQIPVTVAPVMLYLAALLDAALGLGMWIRRWRVGIYLAQIGLMVFYSVVVTLWLPEFWAHPYGPMIKNLPMLALTVLLLWLEKPLGHRAG